MKTASHVRKPKVRKKLTKNNNGFGEKSNRPIQSFASRINLTGFFQGKTEVFGKVPAAMPPELLLGGIAKYAMYDSE